MSGEELWKFISAPAFSTRACKNNYSHRAKRYSYWNAYWQGRYVFRYPACCVKEWLNSPHCVQRKGGEINQRLAGTTKYGDFVFLPCRRCTKRLISGEMTLERLLKHRPEIFCHRHQETGFMGCHF